MKKLVYLLITAAAIFGFSGCKATEEIKSVNYDDSSDITETMYMGDNGWSVSYYEQFFNMNELIKGQDIELIYKGKCKGSAYVEIAEVKGKTAKDLIEEKKAEYESTSEIYDGGRVGKAGYVFYVPDITPNEKIGNDRYGSVEIIDMNDGALIITASQIIDDETEVSDRISDIINSIEFDD